MARHLQRPKYSSLDSVTVVRALICDCATSTIKDVRKGSFLRVNAVRSIRLTAAIHRSFHELWTVAFGHVIEEP
jgi:hypothetical protein